MQTVVTWIIKLVAGTAIDFKTGKRGVIAALFYRVKFMKRILIIIATLILNGCFARGLSTGANLTGDYFGRMAQYEQQKEMIQLQNSYQSQRRVYLEHEVKPTSGSYCIQLSDGVHCY